ncbi:twin-arginine translocase subunit TatC [Nocardioides marmoraquaticus]
MSAISGVLGLFSGKPRHPVGDGGRMALSDHFRELRARVMRIALYLVVTTTIAFFFYDQLFALILEPYQEAAALLPDNTQTEPVITGIGQPLLLQIKLCALAGVIASSPLWLYEIWAFIVPGLHQQEKRATRVFALIAGPLFIVGVASGYWVLPRAIATLIGFTQDDLVQLTEFGAFFSFVVRMLLVFGIAYEIPLFVIMLNLAGIVSGRALGRYRPFIVVGTFVFAAVATPSTDPFSMLFLAIPLLVLLMLSEAICRLLDKRKGKHQWEEWDDDTASPI